MVRNLHFLEERHMATAKKTPARGRSKGSKEISAIEKEIEEIKAILADLKKKIDVKGTKKRDLAKLSSETLHKLGDMSTEVVKAASEVLDQALRYSQRVTSVTLEGAKKVLEEAMKKAPSEETKKPRKTTRKKATARKTTRATKKK